MIRFRKSVKKSRKDNNAMEETDKCIKKIDWIC